MQLMNQEQPQDTRHNNDIHVHKLQHVQYTKTDSDSRCVQHISFISNVKGLRQLIITIFFNVAMYKNKLELNKVPVSNIELDSSSNKSF